MNKTRQKQIDKAIAFLEEAKALLDTAQSEEQEFYDNMSEKAQEGEKGEKASEAANALQEAADYCEHAIDSCNTAKGDEE
jgi:hypothetical protein